MNIQLLCPRCGKKEEYSTHRFAKCDCGTPYLLDYSIKGYASELTKLFSSRPKSLWRYLELLPPIKINPVSLGEGGTFTYPSEGLSRFIGLRRLYIKNEATNPTGAFTDRGASVELTKSLETGAHRIICVASGNLAVSIAAYSAKAGIPCSVYLKHGVEQVKILQALAYDAEVFFTNDPTVTIKLISQETVDNYLVTTSSPLLIEGYKTSMVEILEQFDWNPPDWVSIPIGSGAHVTAVWKALKELRRLELLKSDPPKLLGSQISSCAPIAEAYMKNREDVEPIHMSKTFFPDIAEPNPSWAYPALKAIRELGGTILTVDEEELMRAVKILAKTEGILAEPAAAVALAAIIKAVDSGIIKRDESVVYIVTGSGMKDPSTIQALTESKNSGKIEKEKRIGSTKKKILELLSEKPMHGYLLQKELAVRYGLKISLPTIYEHLRDLESMGLIQKSLFDKNKLKKATKKYHITGHGREIYDRLS